MSTYPTYTPEQIQLYFERIALPTEHRTCAAAVNPERARTLEDGLPFLEALMRHQLASVPFENLELHYSSHHTISLDHLHLFHKIVERDSGRGGYCMENNLFFATVLRSLGFEVRTCGARICRAIMPGYVEEKGQRPSFSGW